MSTRKDIAEIIGYMKLAFPNYSPDVTSPINTVDVLLDLLGDIPAETLKLAVRAACAEAGRAFAPAVARSARQPLNYPSTCWGSRTSSKHGRRYARCRRT